MSFHSYRGQPSARATQQQTSTWSQAKTRHPVGSFDQFGRHWSWSADNRSGMPASIKSPDFSAPWYPDQQYLNINPDDTTELYIDLPGMFRDRKAALISWHKNAVRWAVRNKLPAPKLGIYTDDIIEQLGEPPRALEMIVACAQEHPWVLGLSDIPDPRLERFVEGTSADVERDFEEYDFGIDSYEAAVAGQTPKPSKKRSMGQKTFTSLADLEAAAEASAGMEVIDGSDELDALDEPANEDGVTVREARDATSDFDIGSETDVDEDEPEIVLEDDLDDGIDPPGADALQDLEDEIDPEARGGQLVRPGKQDLARRQGARRPSQTSRTRKSGHQRSLAGSGAQLDANQDGDRESTKGAKSGKGGKAWDLNKAKGRSLADGAKPFVG